MKLAIDAATGTAEPTAWTHVQLGKLYFNHGRSPRPSASSGFANAVYPRYAYGLDALAAAQAARGQLARRDRARARGGRRSIPLPQYVARARRPLRGDRPAGRSRGASTR